MLGAEGDPAGALTGLVGTALGDRTTSTFELGNARATFAELAGRPVLDRVAALLGGSNV